MMPTPPTRPLLQVALQMPQRMLMGLVQGYRLLLSPWLGSACRFTPTCSAYALDALAQHGAARGSYLSAARLVRCHPWCAGGFDPVPECVQAPQLFTRLLEKAGTGSTSGASPASAPSSVSKTLL